MGRICPATCELGHSKCVSVQFGWGTLLHHNRYRISPNLQGYSAPYRICPAIPVEAFNRICPVTEDWGIIQFGVYPVPPRTGALYRLLVEYVQLPENWGILSVGLSSLAGAPCCTITDTEYLQILGYSAPYRIYPAYYSSCGIQ